MAPGAGVRRGPLGELFSIPEAIPDRVALSPAPDPELFRSYVVTRAAARALSQINAGLDEPRGKLFWIGGPSGIGKTHFLNYLLALESRAGSVQPHRGRRISFTVELSARMRLEKLENLVLDALARALGADDPHHVMSWHRARGVDAFNIALAQARRTGVPSIAGFIDLGAAQTDGLDYIRALAEVAAGSRQVRLTIFAAARTASRDGAVPLEVAPADSREKLHAAMNRARTMGEKAEQAAAQFYRDARIGVEAPGEIFPFHPDALSALQSLADSPGTLAALATLIRDSLSAASRLDRLIYPCDLGAAAAVTGIVRDRIGDVGWTAAGIARDAIRSLPPHEKKIGDQIIATLAVQRAAFGDRALGLDALADMLPSIGLSPASAGNLIRRISELSAGVVRLDRDRVVFDPVAAGAPMLSAFHGALVLAKKFAPEIADAADAAHLAAAEARLNDAMADAAEKAARTGEVIRAALTAEHLQFPEEHRRTIDEYVSLAGAGAHALEEAGADPARRDAAMRVIADYEALAAAADMVPQMHAMLEYLEGTGLRVEDGDHAGRDPQTAALETERQLLAAELTPRILLRPRRNLEALRARFQKFRWSYATAYQAAHGAWREELERLAALAEDIRLNAAALRRLNAIALLGPPEGEENAAAAARIDKHVKLCEAPEALAFEIVPRCSSCGYVLGTRNPRAGMSDVKERIGAAIARKVAALSKSAIARIIQEHDHARRLEGFLKITQAAQSDALVRVLDEDLARYLARLLEENAPGAPRFGGPGAHKRAASHNGGGSKRPRHPRH